MRSWRWRGWCRWWICGDPNLPPNALCLWSRALFFGYLLVRAVMSPVAYLAWPDEFAILGALVVYLLTACYLTDPRRRLWLLGALLALAGVNLAVGARQFSEGSGFMLFGFLRSAQYLGRASGLYICPDHLAGFLEIVACLTLAMAFWGRCRAWVRLLLGYCAACCAAGLLMTGSRGGALSFGAGLGVLTVLGLWRARAAGGVFWRALLAVLIALGLFAGGVTAWRWRTARRCRDARAHPARPDGHPPEALAGGDPAVSRVAGVGHRVRHLPVLRTEIPRSVRAERPRPPAQRLPRTAGGIRRGGRGGLAPFPRRAPALGLAGVPAHHAGYRRGHGEQRGGLEHRRAWRRWPACSCIRRWISTSTSRPTRCCWRSCSACWPIPGAACPPPANRPCGSARPISWPRLALPALAIWILAGVYQHLPGAYYAEKARVALRDKRSRRRPELCPAGAGNRTRRPDSLRLPRATRVSTSPGNGPDTPFARSFREAAAATRTGRPSGSRPRTATCKPAWERSVPACVDFDAADAAFQQALRWDPNSGYVLVYDGFYLQNRGDLARAQAAYERARALSPYAAADNGLAEIARLKAAAGGGAN